MQNKQNLIPTILLTLTFLLVSCSTPTLPETQTPLTIINVQLPPFLEHWAEDLHACALTSPNMNVNLFFVEDDKPLPFNIDLGLRFKDKIPGDKHVSIIGYEKLVFILNPANPLSSLSTDTLRSIFRGDYANWNELPEIKQGNIEFDSAIAIIKFGNNHPTSILIKDAFNLNQDIYTFSHLAISKQDMIDSVSNTSGSIGYLFQSEAEGKIKEVTISDETNLITSLEQPVLAVTSSEPQAELFQLLLCLQESK